MCNLAIKNPSNVGFPQTTLGKILVYKYKLGLNDPLFVIRFSIEVSKILSHLATAISPNLFATNKLQIQLPIFPCHQK